MDFETLTLEIKALREKEEALTKALASREAKEAELKETIEKIQKRLDENEVKRKRVSGEFENPKALEFKNALNMYIKTGRWPADMEVKVLEQGSEGAGGYIVAPEYATEIIKGIRELSPMRGLVRVITTGTNRIYWPVKNATTTAAFITETGTRSEIAWTPFAQTEIAIYEAYHRVDVTNWLLEDAFADAEAFVREEMAEAFAALEGNIILLGTGSNQPYGITAELAADNIVQLATPGVVTDDEIKATYFRIRSPYAKNARWLFNRNVMLAISLLKDEYGRYILRQLGEGPEWVLMGAPVVEAPDLASIVDDDSSYFALFGDFKRAYILADRLDITLLRDPYSAAATGSIVIHARKRWGGRMVLPEAVAALQNRAAT